MRPIYLDHNATAPLDPEVVEAMRPHWLAAGNAESRHSFGRGVRRALDEARETVASILNAEPSEVVFTSGGTEANNLALFGLMAGGIGVCSTSAQAMVRPGTIVTSPIEHPAVAEPLERLEAMGCTVSRVGVGSDGRVDVDEMIGAISDDSRLATLILAHNETGVIQQVGELARRAAELGVPVHTDAVQAVGRIPVDFRALGVATLAASAHKFHGPVGVGVLLVRKDVNLGPHLLGGGQQGGRRPGTPAVALAVGFATALAKWHRDGEERMRRWRSLRDRLEAGLVEGLGRTRVVRTGPKEESSRLPQTLHVGFPGIDGDALLMGLDLAGVACSLGSACASGSTQPSTTLVAMGMAADRLRSSVRFSLGALTFEEEIDEAIERIVRVVERLSIV
jgi:cysteine desulfurase